MKSIAGGCAITLLTFFAAASVVAAEELDEHLRFLEPLMDKEWVGGFVGSEPSDLRIVLRFDPILNGRAVRYVRDVERLNYSGVTQFYWNPSRSEVCFLSLNSRGIVGEGVVDKEGDGVVLRGKSYWPDKTMEFRTELEIDPQGTLSDTFLRWENGEWVRGHLQEFVANRRSADE